eukprot:5012688-Pyramimonas_sp.AAC.1
MQSTPQCGQRQCCVLLVTIDISSTAAASSCACVAFVCTILTVDQRDAGSAGIFSRCTNQTATPGIIAASGRGGRTYGPHVWSGIDHLIPFVTTCDHLWSHVLTVVSTRAPPLSGHTFDRAPGGMYTICLCFDRVSADEASMLCGFPRANPIVQGAPRAKILKSHRA